MAAGVGGTLGSVVGGSIGTAIAPGVGTAIGSALGGALGSYGAAALTNQSAFDITESERENQRRLAELRRRQELGTLGLSEREQQSLFMKQQGQIQGQLQQAQQNIRASGAAGMMSGAGLGALQQAQLAEGGAQQMATVQRDIEARNIEEAAKQRAEIEERIATKDEYELRRKQAREAMLEEALGVGEGELVQTDKAGTMNAPSQAEMDKMATALGIPADKVAGIFPFLKQNPDLAQYFAMAMGG